MGKRYPKSKGRSKTKNPGLHELKGHRKAQECSQPSGARNYSVDQLIDKAEKLIDTFEYEAAQKFCQRALEMDADNIRALEASGTLLLELGNEEAAKQCFGRAVEISPENGHQKYMCLGQLFDGALSIQFYQKGIELMVKELQNRQEQEVAAACALDDKQIELKRSISSAYCSVAETYMTDCCDDDGAEENCKNSIEKAIESDDGNPEAYQQMASYLLVKQEKEDAKNHINKSVSLWLPKFKEREKRDSKEFDPVEAVQLSYQTRIQTAQILTEVGEYDTACEVLEGLLDENDEVIQVWYMLGFVNHLQGPDYTENARHYLQKAMELSKKLLCDDKPLLEHMKELLEELGSGEKVPVTDDAEDDEWEDVDSDEDETEEMES